MREAFGRRGAAIRLLLLIIFPDWNRGHLRHQPEREKDRVLLRGASDGVLFAEAERVLLAAVAVRPEDCLRREKFRVYLRGCPSGDGPRAGPDCRERGCLDGCRGMAASRCPQGKG